MGEVVPEDDPDPVQLDTPYLTILAIVVPICGVVLGFIGDRIAAYLYSNDQGQWVALGYVALPVYWASSRDSSLQESPFGATSLGGLRSFSRCSSTVVR